MVHHPFSPVTVSFWDIHHFQPDPYHILYWILLVMYLVIYYMYVCKYHPVSIRYSQNIPSISTWPWQTTSICKCVFAHKRMMCMVIFWEIWAKLVDPCGPSKTPPARWGSLDFNKGANPPSFLLPSLAAITPVFFLHCGVTPAPDAAGHAKECQTECQHRFQIECQKKNQNRMPENMSA